MKEKKIPSCEFCYYIPLFTPDHRLTDRVLHICCCVSANEFSCEDNLNIKKCPMGNKYDNENKKRKTKNKPRRPRKVAKDK